MRRMNSSIRAAVAGAAALCIILLATPRNAAADGDDTPLMNLVALASQRLALAVPVARWKWANHRPITDKSRETALLADVEKRARAAGVDPAFARMFFEDQIEANKERQAALFDQWRVSKPPEGPAPDLATSTRPALEQLTQSMIVGLARVQPLRDAPDCPLRLARSVQNWKSMTRYDANATGPLARALAHICSSGGMGAVG
ncbi:MAG: chorismate mutase [Paraburkholderia sp.]|jgi:chorismate mutase|nr:chorismate mutase [Paraburkholderia sp.]MEA3120577.1 chorismate mutase [Paraburkholderia sp.]